MTKVAELLATGRRVNSIRLVLADQKYGKETQMVKKMKKTTYNIYAYQGVTFTSNDEEFIKAQASRDLGEVNFLPTEEKVGDDVVKRLEVDYFLTKAELRAEQDSDFRADIMQASNFVANPELLTKVNDIEALIGASA